MKTRILLIIFATLAITSFYGVYHRNKVQITQQELTPQQPIVQEIAVKPPESKPIIEIENPTKELSFEQVYEILDKWHAAAPEITEIGVVGKTTGNREIKYIRIGKKAGPKVLIMATIHGNEKLCTMTSMGCINEMLKKYMSDEVVTNLIRTRDIYYIPIASPDGYIANSRHIDGVDPNRNWNGPKMQEINSVVTITTLKTFFNKCEFNAVMSCHDHGKVYFYPWGYTRKNTALDEQYKSILNEMSKASKYKYTQLYGKTSAPPYGYEIDYFHSKGAFAIVNEIGKNFAVYPDELKREIESNYDAFLIFIDKAPLISPALYSILE